MNERAPITDSAWFWIALFSAAGLVGLFAMQGHYVQRQSRLERQYQAHERIANDGVGDPARRDYSRPDETLIPLWPLAMLLVGVGVFASVMLYREQHRREVAGTPPKDLGQ